MKTFYVTFGQSHPLRDNWVEIKAPTYEIAREEAFRVFGDKFAFIRETDSVGRMRIIFPGGRAGKIIDLSHTAQ